MDDNDKMHQKVHGFVGTLRYDYEQDTGAYHDFLHCAVQEDATRLRSGVQQDASYQGDFDRAADWYNANAKIAHHQFEQLKDAYVEHRGHYSFDQGTQPLDLAIDPGSHRTPPGGDGTGLGAGASALGAGTGAAEVDPTEFDPSSVLTDWAGAANEPARVGSHASGAGWSPGDADVGSGLAGTGLDGAGAQPWGAGGLGAAGLGAGSATGVGASAGAYGPPMPPVTTPPERTIGAAAAGRSAPGRAGMGMAPHPGAGRGGRDERTTWLTEDEDVFAPKYLGPETNSAGAIE